MTERTILGITVTPELVAKAVTLAFVVGGFYGQMMTVEDRITLQIITNRQVLDERMERLKDRIERLERAVDAAASPSGYIPRFRGGEHSGTALRGSE